MRVLLIPGGLGGDGGLAIDLRNLAAGLESSGSQVGVACPAGGPDYGGGGQRELLRLRRLPVGRAAEVLGLYTGTSNVLAGPWSVAHVFGSMPSYLTLATITNARRRRVPVVWTPMFHPLRRRVWDRSRAMAPMVLFDSVAPRVSRRVDVVAAATREEAELFRRAGANRVEMLPPVVVDSTPVGPRASADFMARYHLGPGPMVVVVASRDEPRKGLDFAFRAHEILRTTNPGVTLVVIGLSDTSRPTPEAVRLLGRVPDADLAAALAAADVVLVPSLFEAFSRVVIEAWQQARPVVVSDGVALAPTVADLGGAVVPFGDANAAAAALKSLLLDPHAARWQGMRGRFLVEKEYSLSVLSRRVSEIYASLAPVRSGLVEAVGSVTG